MNISYNWLKQYLDFDLSPEETADKLTLLGLEVEDIQTIGSDFEGFVVGEVLSVRTHPNADRLYLCDVNLGDGEEPVQIVCGADNVAANQKVAVAKVGSTLPVPMDNGSYLTIKKAKLRGETSRGMICAEDELGLGDDHSGIMVLNDQLKPGTPLKEALNVEKDTVFEIGLTPNRPDAACHIGVARDLSAVLGKDLINPYKNISKSAGDLSDEISISIQDPEKCHRYVGLIIENVKISESPQWLKNRLISIGLRPINNVVDVTNYVLHEIGQPLHAFDYDLIGDKKIVVKSYDKDKKFVTLDDAERNVPANSLFICDGNGPVAIAGVMGGEDSEVREGTTKILLESAYFEPSSIRKTSKSLALQTDSSYRFERGIDPNLQLRAAYRAAELIAEITGATVKSGHIDVHPVQTDTLDVELRISRINHLLGTTLDQKTASFILEGLEIENQKKDEDTLICTVPTFRPDITREVDLIEEVGRVFDYNNIPRPDSAPFVAPENLSELELFQQRLRSIAKTLQYKEISSNSLLSKKEADLLADEDLQIKTINPVSQENTTLRTHLTGGFLKVVSYNLNRNAKKLRLFELGHVFSKSKNGGTWIDGVDEHIHLLLGLCGIKNDDSWIGDAEPFTVFDLKSDVEAILEELNIADSVERKADGNSTLTYYLNKTEIAYISRVDSNTSKGFDVEKDVFAAEINITELFNLGFGSQSVTYKPIAKFPTFEFDAAFIVDQSIRTGEMTDIIKHSAGKTLQSVSVFDVYEGKNLGENKKSIAFRLTFLDSNKTLTIKDVEPVVQKVVQTLKKRLGAELRS